MLWSVGTYLVALTQDAYYVEGHDPKAWAFAFGLLLVGWLGILYGYYAWIANPFLFLSWFFICRKKYLFGILCAVISLSFMLSFLSYKTIVTSVKLECLSIIWRGPGYWLWVASAGLSLLSAVVGIIIVINNNKIGWPH